MTESKFLYAWDGSKPGIGFVLGIGKWAKPMIDFTRPVKRLCLGFVAITFFPYDGDSVVELAAIGAEAIINVQGEE